MIDLEFLRGLIEAVDQSGIDSLEISRGGTRIRVAKTPPPLAGSSSGAAHAPSNAAAAPAAASPPPPPAAAPEPPPAAPSAPARENLVEVKSPMVGTFYRAPSPEAPPYVEVGTRVSKGQTLCIVEAMKLMNEIPSDVTGEVVEVLAENAGGVEYDQPLFYIKPE